MTQRDLLVIGAAGGAWGGAWWGTGSQALWGLVVLGAAAGAATFLRTFVRLRALIGGTILAALCVGAAGGLAAGAVRLASDERSPLVAAAAEQSAAVSLVALTSDPRLLRDGRAASPAGGPTGSRCALAVRVESIEWDRRTISVRSRAVLFAADSWCGLPAGTRVRSVVTWSPSRDDALSAAGSVRGPPRVVSGPGAIERWSAGVRAGLREASRDHSITGAALVPALVVGDESLLPEEVVDDLRGSGLTHLSAVSGANVSIVLGAVLLLARWMGARALWLTLVGLATLVGFVLIARPEPSVLRAAVMGAVVVVSAMRAGAVRPPAALAASVLVLVLIDPWLSRAPGFALSVAATAGLVVLVRRWTAGGVGRVRAALMTALAAQVAVAPLIAGLNGRLDIGGIMANVLAEAAVAPATVLGFAATAVSPVAPWLARDLAWAASIPAEWIVRVADVVARERWATLPWPAGPIPALVLAALVAAAFAARWVRISTRGDRGARPVLGTGLPRERIVALVALGLVLVTVAGLPIAAKAHWPPQGWRILMCDVGQGDAIVLDAGRGRGILIDAGPDSRQVDRCLRDAGISRLLVIVLTHFHVDHVNGLRGAMRDRRVDQILVSPLDDPPEPAQDVRSAAAASGVPVAVADVGARAAVGPWLLEVLGPSSLDPGDGSPPNNASVLLRVSRDGLSALFLGDAELQAQRDLLRAVPAATLNVDVLKVAHHGSAVQDPLLLGASQPRLALVPVGCRNRYGHPDAGTLSLVQRTGAVVGRTDTQGDVAVVDRGGRLALVARGAAPTRGPAARC